MKNKLTTKEAFNLLISEKSVWNKLNIPKSTVDSYRKRSENNKLSIEKMEEILLKSGYQVIQEKLWTKND